MIEPADAVKDLVVVERAPDDRLVDALDLEQRVDHGALLAGLEVRSSRRMTTSGRIIRPYSDCM